MYVYLYIIMYNVCLYNYVYTCMYVCVYIIYIYICIYNITYVYMYIYIYIYIYIYRERERADARPALRVLTWEPQRSGQLKLGWLFVRAFAVCFEQVFINTVRDNPASGKLGS